MCSVIRTNVGTHAELGVSGDDGEVRRGSAEHEGGGGMPEEVLRQKQRREKKEVGQPD